MGIVAVIVAVITSVISAAIAASTLYHPSRHFPRTLFCCCCPWMGGGSSPFAPSLTFLFCVYPCLRSFSFFPVHVFASSPRCAIEKKKKIQCRRFVISVPGADLYSLFPSPPPFFSICSLVGGSQFACGVVVSGGHLSAGFFK